MAEYIEREAVLELGYWHGEHPDVDNPCPDGVDAVDTADIECIPAADVAPVVHGRWEQDADGDWYCTHCNDHACICDSGKERTYRKAYCPNCGAKMQEV